MKYNIFRLFYALIKYMLFCFWFTNTAGDRQSTIKDKIAKMCLRTYFSIPFTPVLKIFIKITKHTDSAELHSGKKKFPTQRSGI